MTIALLTSGGIAPCLSASIGEITKNYLEKFPEATIIGYLNGYKGLLTGKKINFPSSLKNKLNNIFFSFLEKTTVVIGILNIKSNNK